jgi:repressor LexA
LNKLNQLVLKGYFTKDEGGYRLLRESITDQYTDIIQIPIFGFAQCGNKGKKIINEYSQEKIPMTIAMLGTKDPSQCFFIRAKGNSMEPKIQDSDLVLVKQQAHYDPNDYVLIEHNELPKLKKILKQDGKLFLESVNRFFDKVEIVKYDEAKIIGVVKKIIKNI